MKTIKTWYRKINISIVIDVVAAFAVITACSVEL